MKFEFMVDDITSRAVVVGNAGMSPVDVHVGRLGLTFMEKLRADDPARRPIRWELRVLPFAEVKICKCSSTVSSAANASSSNAPWVARIVRCRRCGRGSRSKIARLPRLVLSLEGRLANEEIEVH
jgi:hypothetical protein